jgi:hypothetical protein
MAFSITSQMPAPARRKKSRHRSNPSAIAAADPRRPGLPCQAGPPPSLPRDRLPPDSHQRRLLFEDE